MITVIVPTMWKYSPFVDFLRDLAGHRLVNEIIIVDNNETERPLSDVFENPKIKIISFKRNIYVNPAWNIGVLAAQNDKICIINDDVIFDLRVFDRVYDYITPDLGVIGFSVPYCSENRPEGKIVIEDYKEGDSINSFFIVFFVHKNSYPQIPDTLKIFYGDNFIFDSALWNSKRIMSIKDIFYYTPQATTTRQFEKINEFHNREAIEYVEMLRRKGLDPFSWNPNLKTFVTNI